MTQSGPLQDEGRIKGFLSEDGHRLYYGEPDDTSDRRSLRLIARVDRAHVVMLAEQKLITGDQAVALLRAVADTEAAGFADVLDRPRPRGLYLAYEESLGDRCGLEAAGALHTGRSRNDLNATTTLLRVREIGIELVTAASDLINALLDGAERHADVLMPMHTHYQPAMPITFGYYLSGVALAIERQVERVVHLLGSVRRCPLGAHAVAGTDLPLDTGRTAGLLGFEAGPLHAVDAVASRDIVIDLLGLAAPLATTVSRLAADLQLWSTYEFGFIDFPDSLVGTSSAMPQKRNPFLLEALKGRPSLVVGAWVSAVTATKSAPFSNSIEVGTEAMSPVEPALLTACNILALAALVIEGSSPRPDRMGAAAADGLVDATALANDLVRRGVPFRQAHQRVGAAVRSHLEDGGPWPPDGQEHLDLSSAVDAARYGGGPGDRAAILATARRQHDDVLSALAALRGVDAGAAERLQAAVEAVCGG